MFHPISKLKVYRNKSSMEYERDYNQFGVYIIYENTPDGVAVPRYTDITPVIIADLDSEPVEWIGEDSRYGPFPVYAGMSVNLSQRLNMHATGRGSNPAEHFARRLMLNYESMPEDHQATFRAQIMSHYDIFSVKTAHVRNLQEAINLERAVIRLYESMGVQLWNKIKYKTTPPWPNI